MAKAFRLFDYRVVFDDGSRLAMRLWRVPAPVPPSGHMFKYALFFGTPDARLVLFDNERGKGDHKHIREVEYPYVFETPEKLVADFQEAVRVVRDEEGK